MSASSLRSGDTLMRQHGNQVDYENKAPLSPLSHSNVSSLTASPTPMSLDASTDLSGSNFTARTNSTTSPESTRESTASAATSTELAHLPVDCKPSEILPLSIPTKHEHLLSGFSYHQGLFDVHVSPRQWELFNEDIQKALKPSNFDRMAARLSKLKVLPIGPVYLTLTSIKAANNRAIEKKILQSLQDDVGENIGELAATMKRWNDETFAPLDLEVNIRLNSSALKRIQKEDRKCKEKEKKTMANYGTTSFYPDEEEEDTSPDADVGKKYKIVISRLSEPPGYSELGTENRNVSEHKVSMLDGTPIGAVEMPGSSVEHAIELPASIPASPAQAIGTQHASELPGESIKT